MPEESLAAMFRKEADAAFSNYKNLKRYLSGFSMENQNRLLLQAGLRLKANENLYFYLTFQKLATLKDEREFKREFDKLVEKLNSGTLNLPSAMQKEFEQMKAREYSRASAEQFLKGSLKEVIGMIRMDVLYKINNELKTEEEIAKMTGGVSNKTDANLYYLTGCLQRAESLLNIMAESNFKSIQQAFKLSDVENLSSMQRRVLFEMVARDLLLNDNPNINQFLPVAIEYLSADPRAWSDFITNISQELMDIPKNDAVRTATNFFLRTNDQSVNSTFVNTVSPYFTLDDTKKLLADYAVALQTQLNDSIYHDIRAECLAAIKQAATEFVYKKPEKSEPLAGYLASMQGSLDKLRHAEDLMTYPKKKDYLVKYADRLESSYLYHNRKISSDKSSEKSQEKVNLLAIIKEIQRLNKDNKLDENAVNEQLQKLESAVEKVRKASQTRHTTQLSFQLFGKSALTKNFVKQSSKTEQAIETAKPPSFRR